MNRLPQYRLDTLPIITILAAVFDAATTFYFLQAGVGVEKNWVLARLLQHSFAWLFVYQFVRPMMIPFFPDLSRQVLSVFFLTVCSIFILNNLAGVLTGDYFATRMIGFSGVLTVGTTLSIFTYVTHITIHWQSLTVAIRETFWLLFFISTFFLIEILFYLLGLIM